MKKFFISILCLIILGGCQTQEEIRKQKEEEELNKIKEEVQNSEIPEDVKNWTFDIKTKEVLTVFCISTSKKCETLKTSLEEVKNTNGLNYYYFEVDKLDDSIKKNYKEYFELKDYTGYLPYLMLSKNDKLIKTDNDIFNKEDLLNFLTEE